MKPGLVIAILAVPVFGVALYFSMSGGPGGPPGIGNPDGQTASSTGGQGPGGPASQLVEPEPLAGSSAIRTLLSEGADAADIPPQALLQSAIQVQVAAEDGGDPIGEVQLILRSGTGSDLDLPVPFVDFVAEATSDARGACSFKVPPMGVYTVRATKEGFAPREVGPILPGDQVTIRLRAGHVLSGVVFDIETEAPIADAAVRLLSNDKPLLAETDADGAFEIRDLAEGLYAAETLAEGYDVDMTVGVQIGTTGALPLSIGLRPGALLRGLVKDGVTEKPIGGAEVTVVAQRGSREDPESFIEMTALSAADGTFEVKGVSRTSAELMVHSDGYARFRRQIQISDDETEREENVALYPGVQVSGVVLDPSGSPVAKGKVRMGGVLATDVAQRTVDTGLDGTFSFEEVRPGLKFSLVAVGPSEALAPGVAEGLVAHIGTPIEGLKIYLALAGEVRGSVIDERFENVPHARIVIEGISDLVWRAMGEGPIQYADSSGEFEFAGLPERSLTLTANHGPIVSQPRIVQVVPGGVTADIRLRLVDGAVLSGVVVDPSGKGIDDVLVTAFAQDSALSVPSGSGGISKRGQDLIKKAAGKEGAGDRILQSVTGGKAHTTAFRSLARTSEDGSFSLLGLDTATKLAIVLEHDEYAPVHEFNVPVTGQQLRLKMVPMLAITGRVLDKRTRKPIPSFFVSAKPARGGTEAKSLEQALSQKLGKSSAFQSADGSFKLGGLQQGQYEVTFRAEGYREIPPFPVNLSPSFTPMRVEMPLSSVIFGRVIGPNGGVIERVPVFARAAPGGQKAIQPKTKTTNVAGEYQFKDIPPGSWMIGAGKPTQPFGEASLVQLPEGEEVAHDIRIDATAALTVVVEDPKGFPAVGVDVIVRGVMSGMNIRKKTDGSGRAEFPTLIAEKCNVVATKAPFKPATGQVTLNANDHPTTELELKDG